MISTGTSPDPIINIKFSGNDNYILSGTVNNAVNPADFIAYSDAVTRNVNYASLTSVVDKGVG